MSTIRLQTDLSTAPGVRNDAVVDVQSVSDLRLEGIAVAERVLRIIGLVLLLLILGLLA